MNMYVYIYRHIRQPMPECSTSSNEEGNAPGTQNVQVDALLFRWPDNALEVAAATERAKVLLVRAIEI